MCVSTFTLHPFSIKCLLTLFVRSCARALVRVCARTRVWSCARTVLHVQRLTYEGGPDTSCFFENPSSVPAKLLANLDPRMKQITYDYLAGHAAHGQHYGALNWFVCCSGSYDQIYGQWGISNSLANFSLAPKWLGIAQALAARAPAPALGAPVPGIVDAALDAVSIGQPTNNLFCGAVEEYYVLNAVAAGQFRLTLNGTSTSGNVTLTLGVNGQAFGTAVLETGQPNRTVPVVPMSGGGTSVLKLEAGVSALKITMPDPPHQCVHLYTIAVIPA